jgi:para-nitrobenzyl esterase
VLKVSGGNATTALYGFADAFGRANITPLTDMVLASAAAGSPAAVFESFDASKLAAIMARLAQAKTTVTGYLADANIGVPGIDMLNGAFQVGDTTDRMLDALQIALAASGKNMDDLRNTAAAGTSLTTLFGNGATSAFSPLFRPTQNGFVTGVADSATGAYAWMGVPYAKPPVGSLRWTPPVDADYWGSKETLKFGAACPQIAAYYDMPFPFSADLQTKSAQVVGSEDCLTLNIWRPNTTETNLPVMFYIHGGSNKAGWSGQYPGALLAQEQHAVVVTINYRMNLFGWFRHPALGTGDAVADSGNYGTLDLIQGLKFVRRNIAAFGGNPDNITISGQSSGGSDALSLLVSPLAKGLFHKAMVFSSIVRGTDTDSSETFARVLLENLVVKDGYASDVASADAFLAAKGNAWVKSYLQNKTYAQLTSMLGTSAAANMPQVAKAPPNIIYDGTVLPAGTSAEDAAIPAIANGNFNNVPLLMGVTNEEGKLFATAAYAQGAWQRIWNFNPDDTQAAPLSLSDLVNPLYLPVDAAPTGTCGQPNYVAGFNYYANVCGAVGPGGKPTTTASYWSGQAALLAALQPKQSAVYAYDFAWAQQPAPWNVFFGAAHTGDLPFIFGNFGPGWISFGFNQANKPGRESLGLAMRSSIGAFLGTGNPNNASLGTTWTPWTPGAGNAKRLIFNADQSGKQIQMSTTENPI